jgi:hypothetical protein
LSHFPVVGDLFSHMRPLPGELRIRGQDINTISGFVESYVCSQAMKKPATSAPSLRRCGVELVKNRDPAQQGGHRIGPTPEGLALERRRAVSSARSIGGRPLRLEETCCLETGLLLPASICHKRHVVIWHSGGEFLRWGLSFIKTRDSTEVSECPGVGLRLFAAHENRPVVSAGRYVLLVRPPVAGTSPRTRTWPRSRRCKRPSSPWGSRPVRHSRSSARVGCRLRRSGEPGPDRSTCWPTEAGSWLCCLCWRRQG